jgi:hypothetical protein
MPYVQITHNRLDDNNKVIDRPLFEGDGFLDILKSTGNIVKSNMGLIKDGTASVANVISGVKSAINTHDDHKRAGEEIKTLQQRRENEMRQFQKILQRQEKISKQNKPVFYATSEVSNFEPPQSSDENVINVIKNIKKGNGLKVIN